MSKPVFCMAACLLLALSVGGCDKITDTSRATQSVSKAVFEETKASWQDFFTYHPPLPAALPQTRYCYQMQSDVVCYDGEQAGLTSKLVGYQDGDNISWVQPGGGALGVSGGAALALRPLPAQPYAAGAGNNSSGMIDTGPVLPPPLATGEISVNRLPPLKAKSLQK